MLRREAAVIGFTGLVGVAGVALLRRRWSRGNVAEVGPAEFGGMEPRTEVVREPLRGEFGPAADGSDGPLRVRDIRRGREDVAVEGDGLCAALVFGFSGAAIVGVAGSIESDGKADFGGDGAEAARGMVVVVVFVTVVLRSGERA